MDKKTDQTEIITKINKHCAERLRDSYQPYLFKFYDDALPVAPSGKLDILKMRTDVKDLFDCRIGMENDDHGDK